MIYPLLLGLGLWEILLIALVILLLLGGRKIPELMHGIGKGISNYKKGLNEVDDQSPSHPSEKKK